ncbi:hypothetical protein PSAC2689_120087 [Paraburkholderia sacchari]
MPAHAASEINPNAAFRFIDVSDICSTKCISYFGSD